MANCGETRCSSSDDAAIDQTLASTSPTDHGDESINQTEALDSSTPVAAHLKVSEEDTFFEHAESGASVTFPVQCSSLNLGSYAMIKGFPCKIVHKATSKTGKHGHAKVNLVGLDIFNGRKHEDFRPSTHNIEVPYVKRIEYQVR